MPFSASHCFICCTEFGFSRSVSSCIAAVSLSRERISITMACLTSSISTPMPRSLISWSSRYSSQRSSGTGNLASLCCICISVSTSRRLYALNRSHFSGSVPGRFRVLPPLVFVALQGTQKYRIRSLPSVSFCFSSPSTAPAFSSERGSPI